MARIYSNYSEEEIILLQQESEKMGLSLSAYQKYRTLLSLTDNNTIDMADLISKMKETLSQRKKAMFLSFRLYCLMNGYHYQGAKRIHFLKH